MHIPINAMGTNSVKLNRYFIVGIPLMFAVIIAYYVFKDMFAMRLEDPLRRGTYENIYSQFSHNHPQLWSRLGPRSDVTPEDILSKLKWRLIKHWFAPSRAISTPPLSGTHSLGVLCAHGTLAGQPMALQNTRYH